MEIHILAKSTTNRCFFTAVCFIALFLLGSCQTNKIDEYVKPDFTNAEILENEVQRIRASKDDDAIYSLWLSTLLYAETNESAALELYHDCVDAVKAQFNTSVQEEAWLEALRLGDSLISIMDLLPGALYVNLGDDFVSNYDLAKKSYIELPKFSSSSENNSETRPGSEISTFITGVVTIWVDLGVKVERGLGFPNRSLGSGFFIDDRGYIITNHHVISELVDPEYEGYSRLYIKLSNDSETRIPAKVVGWDKTLDLALLKTEISAPYVYSLGSSRNLNVGKPIYAIGSPVGLENTITSGIISAFDRQLLSTAAVMQIDAAVNSGNSGGPLINDKGEVQGIVFAGLASFQGLNFAIPVEYLSAILLRLYSEGEVQHSWIGAYGKTIKRYPSDELGLGVEVLYVMPGSPADLAGLKAGTVVTSINGINVQSVEELQFALIHLIPDSIAIIESQETIESEKKTMPIYLEVRPEYPGLSIYEREPAYKMVYPMFGMELIPSSVGNKNLFTVQSIVKGSIADESGFSVHDPVEIRKTVLTEDKNAVYIETYTKKRKSGYFEVAVAIGSSLDSPFLF